MTRQEMPLFPLQTVLFPGAPLPLVIFEERYKVMLNELLESGGEFGVLLIRSGREVGGQADPYDVGTLARIERCDEVEGGRYRVQARGRQRFRLINMLPARPYPYGEIELLDDSRYEEDERLVRAVETVRTVFPLYFKMALMLTDQWSRSITLPDSPHRLVNYIAPWLQVDEEVKQRLLELDTAADRVGHLAEVLDELVEQTREEVREYTLRKWANLGTMS